MDRRSLVAALSGVVAASLPPAALAQSPRLASVDYLWVGEVLTLKNVFMSGLNVIIDQLGDDTPAADIDRLDVIANAGAMLVAQGLALSVDPLPQAENSWPDYLAAFNDGESFAQDIIRAMLDQDDAATAQARKDAAEIASRIESANRLMFTELQLVG